MGKHFEWNGLIEWKKIDHSSHIDFINKFMENELDNNNNLQANIIFNLYTELHLKSYCY